MSDRRIWQGTRARLHPSGSYIYGLSRDIYPNDIEKYDITNDTAVIMYNSPYHGDYDLGREFWISENGERIYTATGNSFTCSSTDEYDLLYRGQFHDIDEIRWATQSDSRDLIAVIGFSPAYPERSDQVYLYRESSLAVSNIIQLPPQIKKNDDGSWRRVNLESHFVFFDPTGDSLRVVVNGTAPEGNVKWGILTLDLNAR